MNIKDKLKFWAEQESISDNRFQVITEAIQELERLQNKCNMQSDFIKRMMPDKFSDTLFIHDTLGKKDQNNMPEKLLIVPAYGCDWAQVYVRTEETTGPEY